MRSLSGFLPDDAASLLARTLTEIQQGAGGGLLSLGAGAALWAASSGMLSVITALNVAYDLRDPRPWWRVRLVALGLTVVFALFTLGTLVLLVLGPRLAGMLADRVGMGPRLLTAWSVLEWPVAAAAVVTGIALVYYLAPAVEQPWHWVTPGSVFALAAWLAASAGLRYYVRSVGG